MNQQDRESRATDYVLGEMSASDRSAFEAEMASNETLKREVAELRSMASLLTDELQRPAGELPTSMRQAIEQAATRGASDPSERIPTKSTPVKWMQRTTWLAAAALLLGVFGTLSIPKSAHQSAQLEDRESPPPPMASSFAQLSARGAEQQCVSAVCGNRHATSQENPFQDPSKSPLSTFSIDVDTASYSLVRSHLQQGGLPPTGAVRIEEMVNAFAYNDTAPKTGEVFSVHLDLGVAPWAPSHKLARVALRGKDARPTDYEGVNLVFLIDTSGSMQGVDRLQLLVQGLRLLVDKLRPNDRVAIVTYAGSAGLVLPSTRAAERATILNALGRLEAGGSTNGGAGIDLAYQEAARHFIQGGINRVILATDGDFNVGATSDEQLIEQIRDKAKSGVFLSVLGFGMGNLNDSMLEQIADKGNGMYAYIDNEQEARRAMADGYGSLITIAKDVKLQVEFNPREVGAYRLIGYDNRMLEAQDFNNDKKDAGELGAGHTVTALYELIPPGLPVPEGAIDPLRYQASEPRTGTEPGEVMTVKLRYKDASGSESKLQTFALSSQKTSLATMSSDFRFAAAVASFGMLLRGSNYKGQATYDMVRTLAADCVNDDPRRVEFLRLVEQAKSYSQEPQANSDRDMMHP